MAVLLVVGFHLWPGRFPGGYVGVDVFFVISGFLITAHLLRELAREGRIAFGQFWARRARRLLPAAYLVLAVSAVATWLLLPQAVWGQNFREILASSVYVQNWQLASDAVDYLAADNAASTVQHYWTLSVEEQFYLVWPILIALGALIARRLRTHRIAVLVALLGLVTAVSFGYSLWVTTTNPAAAYFVTPARAWQFGAGALLALVTDTVRVRELLERTPALARSLLSWAGIVAIVWCGFAFSGSTPFPGTAALVPVLGALAILVAGAPRGPLSPIPLAALRPVQYVGDISYSVYLWHWPPIIIVPFVLGRDLGVVDRPLILIGTLIVSALCKKYVEDPIRGGRRFGLRRRSVTFGLTGLTAALLVGSSALGMTAAAQATERATQEADRLVSGAVACAGAASMDPEKPCSNPDLDTVIRPAPGQHGDPAHPECFPEPKDDRLVPCDFGPVEDRSVPHVVLIGDSHARAMLPALEDLADQGIISVTTVLKSSCAWSNQPLVDDDAARVVTCATWRGKLADWTSANISEGDVVITTAYMRYLTGSDEERTDGLVQAWRTVADRGISVIAVRDNPRQSEDPNVCLLDKDASEQSCSTARSKALRLFDAISPAVKQVPGAKLLDLNDYYCTADVCPVVIGGVNVYRDSHHISTTYWHTMTPYLLRELRRLGALPPA